RRGPEGRRFLHRTLVRLVVDALRHEWSSAVAVFRGEGKGTTPASRRRVLDNPDRQWQRAHRRGPRPRARRDLEAEPAGRLEHRGPAGRPLEWEAPGNRECGLHPPAAGRYVICRNVILTISIENGYFGCPWVNPARTRAP